MALLDFLKKKPVSAPVEYSEQSFMPQPSGTPVEQVMIMRQQGASAPQIIQTLQRNYSPQQIADAMGQAEARFAGESYPLMPAHEQFAPVPQSSVQNVTEEVESQINEKWHALSEQFKPLNEWKEHVEAQMSQLSNDVSALKSEVEKIHKAVFAQIQEYGQNLRDVGAEIKAIEKVFTQVLPELTTSVQDISRAAKSLKSTEKIEKITKK